MKGCDLSDCQNEGKPGRKRSHLRVQGAPRHLDPSKGDFSDHNSDHNSDHSNWRRMQSLSLLDNAVTRVSSEKVSAAVHEESKQDLDTLEILLKD
ncbi:hypothetical protein ACOMHN_014007 [Nucella lapillus]